MCRKINVYLDDLRCCPDGFVIARNVDEAKRYLKEYDVSVLSLDHDLGVDEKGYLLPSGYDLVKYICEEGVKVQKIYIHTDNAVGRENMYETLLAAQRRNFISNDILIYNYPLVPNRYAE